MNNHKGSYQKKPRLIFKRLEKQGKTPDSPNFDKENGKLCLWKSLWNLCITFHIQRKLQCYGNYMHNPYSAKTELF